MTIRQNTCVDCGGPAETFDPFLCGVCLNLRAQAEMRSLNPTETEILEDMAEDLQELLQDQRDAFINQGGKLS